LTGAGGHFCAGADVKEFESERRDAALGFAYEADVNAAYEALRSTLKPTIAAISGSCVGGGLALALACDFRIADSTSRFSIPAAKLGVVYTANECALLLSCLALPVAKMILFTGDMIDSARAAELGLVDKVVTGSPLKASMHFAEPMLRNAPLSIAGAKLILQAVADRRIAESTEAINALIEKSFASEDYQEGRRAFNEKRNPRFHGK
jgi:enoyl-CoA hydratase/carnithine racemase